MSNSQSEAPSVDTILAEYFTWKGEAIHEVNQTQNYKRMKAKINRLIEEAYNKGYSDGYHTFKELYDHRIALYIALMFAYPERSWFASYHEDGTSLEGWFIAGMHLPDGDITYHLPNVPYFNVVGANKEIEYRHFAPKWDGHTSADVVSRLMSWSAKTATSQQASPSDSLSRMDKE